MKYPINPKSHPQTLSDLRALLLLAVAASGAFPVAAQVRTTATLAPTLTAFPTLATSSTATTASVDEDKDSVKYVPEEIKKRIRAQLETIVPVFDKRLLLTYETPTPWEDNLHYSLLNKLLGETPFQWEGTAQPPADADRLEDESKSMRIRRVDGSFRYQSRKRVFTTDLKGKGVPAADIVTRQVQGILQNLGFPLVEAGRPDVKTQEMGVSGESGAIAERFPIYSFFVMNRHIEGIPVEGSDVRAAVNPRGEVQRLKIAWPHFKVQSGVELRSRERVLEETFQKVIAQDPTEKLELASRLVYTRTVKGEFLPAVQVDVSDGETPYRLTIPVAQ